MSKLMMLIVMNVYKCYLKVDVRVKQHMYETVEL